MFFAPFCATSATLFVFNDLAVFSTELCTGGVRPPYS